MSGYVRFERTGSKSIDKILDAIEEASHAYHHTRDWTEKDDESGLSYVDMIQNAAFEAAFDLKK